MKRALITGVTGQDGSYLVELLLRKGYQVHGIIRRASTFNTDRIDSIYQDPHEPDSRLFLHYGDLSDGTGLRRILEKAQPDEVFPGSGEGLGVRALDKVEFLTADCRCLTLIHRAESPTDNSPGQARRTPRRPR